MATSSHLPAQPGGVGQFGTARTRDASVNPSFADSLYDGLPPPYSPWWSCLCGWIAGGFICIDGWDEETFLHWLDTLLSVLGNKCVSHTKQGYILQRTEYITQDDTIHPYIAKHYPPLCMHCGDDDGFDSSVKILEGSFVKDIHIHISTCILSILIKLSNAFIFLIFQC